MREFIYPEKIKTGDRIAILSPSKGIPGIFPGVFERGLQRLRDLFGLVPVEYPTTRDMKASNEDKARDLHQAFKDISISCIFCSIGGEDELQLLKLLDPSIVRNNPKRFLGFSDNTNIHIFMWNLGIVTYYGGSILVQLAREPSVHPFTRESLSLAMFSHGKYQVDAAAEFTDEDKDWGNPSAPIPTMYSNSGWKWINNRKQVIEGITWGGNLAVMLEHLATNKHILANEEYRDMILYLETDEELQSDVYVYRMLMCMGERGLLRMFSALLMGRPKAWSLECPNDAAAKKLFVGKQENAVTKAVQHYHPGMLVILNMDFGHTDPHLVIPNGGQIYINGGNETIFMTY